MKKRLISLLLIATCLFCFCGSALALKEPEVKSAGSVSAGLSKVSGSMNCGDKSMGQPVKT